MKNHSVITVGYKFSFSSMPPSWRFLD